MKKKASLTQKVLLAVVAVALLVGGGYLYYYRIYYEWALQWGLIEPTVQQLPVSEDAPFQNRLIAHGAGEVDWQTKTDSKEAFLNAIAQGFHFIEVDLRKTLDGHYFAAHRYDEFDEITTGKAGMGIIPPTAADVRSRKIFNRYSPLFLTDIADILKEYPDVFLVTDKARDFDLLVKEFPLTDQMIVEVSSVGQYYAALNAGIRFPVLNRIEFDDIKRFNIGMIVVNPAVLAIHEQAIRRYVGKGNGVLVASYPTSVSVPQKYQDIPNLMFYVDKK